MIHTFVSPRFIFLRDTPVPFERAKASKDVRVERVKVQPAVSEMTTPHDSPSTVDTQEDDGVFYTECVHRGVRMAASPHDRRLLERLIPLRQDATLGQVLLADTALEQQDYSRALQLYEDLYLAPGYPLASADVRTWTHWTLSSLHQWIGEPSPTIALHHQETRKKKE